MSSISRVWWHSGIHAAEIQVRFLGGNKNTNERTIKNERINERVKSNRFQDWTIPYLRIRDFTAIGTVTVLIGIINQ